MPRAGHEGDLAKNPYIAYNCVRTCGALALATNGSQTDPIIERIASGMPAQEAFALSLLAMGYERDSLSTPRIAAAVDAKTGLCVLGIVRKDALLVVERTLEPGKAFYLSTYERNCPSPENLEPAFAIAGAAPACRHVIGGGVFASFENPVTAAAAFWNGASYELAVADA
jgi:IMP cyclohydrolase